MFENKDRAKNVLRAVEGKIKAEETVVSELDRNVLPELLQQLNFLTPNVE